MNSVVSAGRTTNKLPCFLTAAICAGTRCLGSSNGINTSTSTVPYGAQRTSSRSCDRISSWSYIHGSGKAAPVGSTLNTDQYLVLSHGHSGIFLELFYGSTGVVMFQDGDTSVRVSSIASPICSILFSHPT